MDEGQDANLFPLAPELADGGVTSTLAAPTRKPFAVAAEGAEAETSRTPTQTART